jgi:hypothetical protein
VLHSYSISVLFAYCCLGSCLSNFKSHPLQRCVISAILWYSFWNFRCFPKVNTTWSLVYYFTISILRVLHYLSICTVPGHNFYGPDWLSDIHRQQSATVYTIYRPKPPLTARRHLRFPSY